MKRILRIFLISLLALWLTTKLVQGFSYQGSFQTLILASGVFTALNLLVRPILRLFFLPLNLLTLGLFSWVVNIAVLYLLILIIPQIKITPFDFAGLSWQGFSAPAMHFSFLATLILSSFVISFISSFLNWLAK